MPPAPVHAEPTSSVGSTTRISGTGCPRSRRTAALAVSAAAFAPAPRTMTLSTEPLIAKLRLLDRRRRELLAHSRVVLPPASRPRGRQRIRPGNYRPQPGQRRAAVVLRVLSPGAQQNPGQSACARVLQRLVEVEVEVLHGTRE